MSGPPGSHARAAAASLAAALAILVAPAAAAATTFHVTRTDDPLPGACNADCTLREAVIAANSGAGRDTIALPAGTYRLRAGAGEDASATGDLDLLKKVTIVGAGAHSTAVDALGHDRAFDVRPGGKAEIRALTVTGAGTTSISGGGIRADGPLTLRAVTVRDNDVSAAPTHYGGGVYASAALTLIGSTIAGNQAYNGGGIYADGPLTVARSTISGNRAGSEGNNGDGGGLQANAATTISDSTIAFNQDYDGAGTGGAIYVGGSVKLRNTIVAGNVANATDLTSSVPDNCGNAPATSQGHNLSDTTDCGLTGPGDRQNAKPRLAPLAENGGQTDTHALLPGSPAIDHGAGCAPTDQRGVQRPQGGACDIGAFEVLPPVARMGVALSAPSSLKLKRFLKGVVATATPTVPAALTFQLIGSAKRATLASAAADTAPRARHPIREAQAQARACGQAAEEVPGEGARHGDGCERQAGRGHELGDGQAAEEEAQALTCRRGACVGRLTPSAPTFM